MENGDRKDKVEKWAGRLLRRGEINVTKTKTKVTLLLGP